VTVIVDDGDELVTYLAPGTVTQYPVGVSHGATCFAMWASDRWELDDRVFRPPGALRLYRHGDPFEVYGFLGSPGGAVSSWYVNFQEPLRRVADGFDTMDEILDLVVAADASTWRRKDEHELELALAMGVVDDALVQRVRGACATVEAQLRHEEAPWDLAWRSWRPDALGELH
jgi:hypothetical protein